MTYTKIPKPTTLAYTNINVQGKEQYDQAALTYDDANTFYDGVNTAAWTGIAKPIGATSFTRSAGMATGLIMSPTYSTTITITSDLWTKIAKPT